MKKQFLQTLPKIRFWFFVVLLTGWGGTAIGQSKVHLRINQLGYLASDSKEALVFSEAPFRERLQLRLTENSEVVLEGKPVRLKTATWGSFDYYYNFDFSSVMQAGEYYLQSKNSGIRSQSFHIGPQAYAGHQETLLEFMRQQRCGYNPTLDMVCHEKDGRSFYGPMPDSTYLDLSGGWHDAGDQLKYLITGSYATAHLLLAFELYPDRFADHHNALGQPGSNGIPDVLDEAKWGLDWIHKMHPSPDVLFHQIADDRDHRGFKIPNQDNSDYGWGANSYRAAYAATGKPQGLGKYKSEATGLANLAGRSAAAMALAARIWKEHLQDSVYSAKCRGAALSLYALGRKQEGYQQGNSYGAPYRYNEETWADDMEWGAAELYALTNEPAFLKQAKEYALVSSNQDAWAVRDTAAHYQLYPFVNMGHYALHRHVDQDFKKELENYYLEGISYTLKRAQQNPFHIGVPFIWCSNNLLTSLVAQVILYEKMTGDRQFQPFLTAQRDWLFGRNPWGTSMFTGLPADGEFPEDVHTSIYVMLGLSVPGGLVDGPIYRSIHDNLLGLTLNDPDEFSHLQNQHVVYQDDVGDYSTNEPTMDGTAGAILMMAHFGKPAE
ncbi:glycoside hydrolase family 9 protein [Cyclobacterium jeungdonense]|uniref:Glycoside hydrolase family 9 protein n=1 Tax=Cyclobacterium jeungdonense TaxID=708087 RepID=A0ABT8C597_9BACT|nr:glycoside hydrolase family 9 protein [Cyclobacterium jeungdonense]MDN3687209.1 glycoside hydrolase family 9 protein [Cyclobacterium jeungdonense]